MDGATLIVPLSFDDEARRSAWGYCRQRYLSLHPALRLVVGVDAWGNEFSKGRAVADGVSRAFSPILVIADGDVCVSPEALGYSILAVMHGAAWSQPHGRVYRLNRRATSALYNTGHDHAWSKPPDFRQLDRHPHPGPTGGGIVVCTRAAYEATGIDPRFIGFGGDDISFARALDTIVGPCQRFDFPMVHLWHPRTPRRPGNRGSIENERLAARYADAAGDIDVMRKLVTEWR